MNYSENNNDSISMEKLLLYCEILKILVIDFYIIKIR